VSLGPAGKELARLSQTHTQRKKAGDMSQETEKFLGPWVQSPVPQEKKNTTNHSVYTLTTYSNTVEG
jgi:hypothetical protein